MNTIHARFDIRYSNFHLDVKLDLPGRGVSAVYGASGAGKTVLLRALAGLERAQGFVQINDAIWQDDAHNVFVPTHQRALGYVAQEAALFSHLNVRANLEYGIKRIAAAQRRVSLAHCIELLGIGPLLDRHIDKLSGGESQRVAIARALATSPQLLLMDEPLAALDTPRKKEILPYLQRLQRELEIPVIYVSHALDEIAQLSDHLVLLECGKVVASGPTAELLTRSDLALVHDDQAGSLICATITERDEEFHLSCAQFDGGQLWFSQSHGSVGDKVRLRILPRDVSITLNVQHDTSILNILPACIAEIHREDSGQSILVLQLGNTRVLTRISTKSVHALQLDVGKHVYAQIKGLAVMN